MKRLLPVLIALALLPSCTQNKQKLEYGTILSYQNGMVLPMKESPESNKKDWCVELLLDGSQVELRSPRALHTCYISFAYDNPLTGAKDMTSVDLDFQDIAGGKYIYAIPKAWFPTAEIRDNIFQTVVYYAPEDVALPMKEVEMEDGRYQFPDYTGYCFIFNRKETRTYFSAIF